MLVGSMQGTRREAVLPNAKASLPEVKPSTRKSFHEDTLGEEWDCMH